MVFKQHSKIFPKNSKVQNKHYRLSTQHNVDQQSEHNYLSKHKCEPTWHTSKNERKTNKEKQVNNEINTHTNKGF